MPSLADIAELLQARRAEPAPLLIGVTGAVAVGKSVFCAELAGAAAAWPGAPKVETVCTDGFLRSNEELAAAGLFMRKGFPESYDREAMRRALTAIRQGPTDFPGYSHAFYDVDPALTRRVERPDVLIVEGLGLHEGPRATGLDVLLYLEADEADVEAWFIRRLTELFEAAKTDPSLYYARFAHLAPDDVRAFAERAWREINLPNLLQHISPARDLADIVVRKGPAHEILSVTVR